MLGCRGTRRIILAALLVFTVLRVGEGRAAADRFSDPSTVFSELLLGKSSIPCSNGRRLGGTGPFCYAPSQFTRYARGLPFAAYDPSDIVHKTARLRPVLLLVGRTSYPPTGVKTYPVGPPQSIDMEYGRVSAPQQPLEPPQRQATYVSVIEYPLSQTGCPRVWRIGPGDQWVFSADAPRQNMTINVRSDGPKAVVSAIGYALFRAERRLPRKPSALERVYVTAPRHLHVGQPAIFWVLVAPRSGTNPRAGYDFDFTLGGAWSRPRTKTPDGSQACGGDNVAGQPVQRHGRWDFQWGDCYELGLILTPRGLGSHTLIINAYSVPVTAGGRLDYRHEKLAPRDGYRWQGRVQP